MPSPEEFLLPAGVGSVFIESGSAEWKKSRRLGIGGSDFSNLIENDYSCQRKLFYEKTGADPDFDDSDNFRLRRGRRQEPVAIAYYEQETGRKVYTGLPTYFATPEFKSLYGAEFNTDILRANVDGLCFDGEKLIVVEVKTLGEKSYARIRKHGLPEHYIAQATWGAGLLGASSWSFVIFSPELDGLTYFDVVFDRILFGHLGSIADGFWSTYLHADSRLIPSRRTEDRVCNLCCYRKTCRAITKSGIDKMEF